MRDAETTASQLKGRRPQCPLAALAKRRFDTWARRCTSGTFCPRSKPTTLESTSPLTSRPAFTGPLPALLESRWSACGRAGHMLSTCCASALGYRALRSFGAANASEDRVIEGEVNAARRIQWLRFIYRNRKGRPGISIAVSGQSWRLQWLLDPLLDCSSGRPCSAALPAYMGQAILANDDRVDFDVTLRHSALGQANRETSRLRRDRHSTPAHRHEVLLDVGMTSPSEVRDGRCA